MLLRSRSLLMVVYIVLILAGVLFLTAPTPAIDRVLYPSQRIVVWSASYIVGGLVALGASLLRLRYPGSAATWFFELAGLILLVLANGTYFVILLRVALPDRAGQDVEFGLIGVSLVVLAFGFSLLVRALETLELISIFRQLERRENARSDAAESGRES